MRSHLPFAVVLGLVSSLAATAHATPRAARLTYFGDPTRSIAIAWNGAPTDTQVHLGTAPDRLDRVIEADEMRALASPLGTAFVAHVSGLEPATTYFYRLGAAGAALHPPAASPAFSFTTMPDDPCTAFRFVLVGDNRADFDGIGPSSIWPDILAETLEHDPAFFVNTGDMVKNGDRADEWSAFIDSSESGWARVPSILTMGNHDEDDIDGDGAIYNALHGLPRNPRSGNENYYAIDIGPIHFVSLNSQHNRPGTTEMTEMVAWLEEDLAAATAPWTIVFFHKAIYSRGNHSTGEENGGALNATLVPIFDRFGVDFVFNGHSHDYERYAPSAGVDREFGGAGRSFPMGAGTAIRGMASYVAGSATTYMVSGGAGALTTEIAGIECIDAACTMCIPFLNDCPDEVYDNDVAGTVVYEGRHNFAVFEVEAGSISVRSFATRAGNVRGGDVIDTFAVTHPSFPMELCGTPPPMPDGGMPDAGPSPDAAVPPPTDAAVAMDAAPPPPQDAGSTGDMGGSATDAGAVADAGPARDAGSSAFDAGPSSGGASDEGGCGCEVAGRRPARVVGPMALALVLGWVAARRRRRR